MLLITADSHLDHGLDSDHIGHILKTFRDRHGFFIETFRISPKMLLVPCALYGPLMGDEPIDEDEVVYRERPGRQYDSRILKGKNVRLRDQITVIAGPSDYFLGALGQPHHMVLYTAYGGPAAAREPGDPTLSVRERDESSAFWSQHALAEWAFQ